MEFSKSRIVLSKRQGWAGSPYFRYDLIKFKLFNMLEKNVAFGYEPDQRIDSCLINFNEGEEWEKRFVFDKCNKNLYKN